MFVTAVVEDRSMPMILEREREYTSQERAALVGFWLGQGECLTRHQVAELTGLSLDRAWHLMAELSRVLPIFCEEDHWQMIVFRELNA